ncbi:DIS3L2 [Mytilus coruscus]|uniref:DIS3L2 n=1 Tax=Mytilus coruscus TaxID=42192 RepID=A0A6J8EIZ7_MYTCO|nr:DIS3L2 [Mytilus coruscus]
MCSHLLKQRSTASNLRSLTLISSGMLVHYQQCAVITLTDLTDNKRETSNPNELHFENLSIAENSDQPSPREGESTIGSSGTREFRNTNSQHGNKGRFKGQSNVRQGNGSGQNQQDGKTDDGKGNNPTSKGSATPRRQKGNNTPGNDQKKPRQDGVSDIFISGMKERNRALNGDIVAVVLHDRDNWKIHVNNLKDLEEKYKEVESSDNANNDNQSDVTPRTQHQGEPDSVSEPGSKSDRKHYLTFQEVMKEGSDVVKNLFKTDDKEKINSANRVLQRTGKVVAMIQPKHSRIYRGSLKLMKKKINIHHCLYHEIPDFHNSPEDHVHTLFISRIKEWRVNSFDAHGELRGTLGKKGEIYAETEGILIENDVDDSEFTEEMLSTLPVHSLPWQIPDGEIIKRRDFRQQCVFTIDPATSRDLDDALSCEKLDDGTYNVGVHIADVSYFLKEDSALDKRASLRATSVYLVQKVIPMLPKILSEELCSLNPNQDRLTFSVVWNISEKGEIAKNLRKARFDKGALHLDQVKLQFSLDEDTGMPNGYSVYKQKDNLTDIFQVGRRVNVAFNIAVAVKIKKHFPDKAILRRHPKPQSNMVDALIAKNLRKARFDKGALHLDQVKLQFSLDEDTGMPNGYSVYKQKDSNRLVEELMLLANIAVAVKIKKHFPDKAILRRHPKPQSNMVDALVELSKNAGFPIDATSAGTIQKSLWRYAESDDIYDARMQVLVNMSCKVMQKAKYFCTGCIDDEELYRHYALNVPVYTHFTSPIRRYADVMVHRTLAAALDNGELSEKSTVAIQSIAENCNDRKINGKRVSDLSSELNFAVLMKQPAIMETFYTKERNNPVLTLYWKPTEENGTGAIQKISIFTKVTCIFKPTKSPLVWMAIIKSPEA